MNIHNICGRSSVMNLLLSCSFLYSGGQSHKWECCTKMCMHYTCISEPDVDPICSSSLCGDDLL